jgi:predicted TPR repeat methyltransferase
MRREARAKRAARCGGQNVRVRDAPDHWDGTYVSRGPTGVSWYEPTPRVSLEMIDALGVPKDAAVIDIGGGTSGLAGELLKRGYSDVTLLDVSYAALTESERRLGDAVKHLHVDLLSWQPEREYALWHDRAVLHFFTDPGDRKTYVETASRAVPVGGLVVFGVFAPDGPDTCSGLNVDRYAAGDLAALLGERFVQRLARRDVHVTPRGMPQAFTWAAFETVG